MSSRTVQIKENTIGRDIGRAFFGVNLRCAQCHDHPNVTEWKQSHAYGLTAFFTRSFPAKYKDKDSVIIPVIGETATGDVEYTPADGKKKIAEMVFLDGTVVQEPASEGTTEKDLKPTDNKVLDKPPTVPSFSRREAFVKVALAPERPHLKRAIVNRVWKKLMGLGFVEPVDMIHDDNPASHPELFSMLSDEFAKRGFDLRWLIATIAKTQTYARSSRWEESTSPDKSTYAIGLIKPLDETQLALSLAMAVGYYDDRLKLRPSASMADLRPVAPWTKIITQFESDADEFEPTADQALFLLNSDYFQQELIGKSRLATSLVDCESSELAEQIYVAVLSRYPTKTETRDIANYISGRKAEARLEVCPTA